MRYKNHESIFEVTAKCTIYFPMAYSTTSDDLFLSLSLPWALFNLGSYNTT